MRKVFENRRIRHISPMPTRPQVTTSAYTNVDSGLICAVVTFENVECAKGITGNGRNTALASPCTVRSMVRFASPSAVSSTFS